MIAKEHKNFAEEMRTSPHCDLFLDIRQQGTILALEYKDEQRGYSSSLRNLALDYFPSQGVLLRPLGNVIYILPPFCIKKEELQEIYQAIWGFTEVLAKKA